MSGTFLYLMLTYLLFKRFLRRLLDTEFELLRKKLSISQELHENLTSILGFQAHFKDFTRIFSQITIFWQSADVTVPACKNEPVFPDLAFFSQNFKINLALMPKMCSYQLQSYQIILFHSCLTKALKVLNLILHQL